MVAELYRYAAFISYSSKDAAFARRLHRALEGYGIPSSLGRFDIIGRGKRNRIYPVFRDREELPTGQLGDLIEASLKASASLVVVCSPNSATSPWVQKEIEYFANLQRHDKIFAVIADKAPLADESGADCTQACFPPAFRGDALAGDKLEPLAADARKGKDGFRNAWLKIVAGIVGVSPGQLIDRDRRRRRNRALMATAGALVVVLALAGAGLSALRANVQAAERRATLFATESLALDADVDRPAAILMALYGDPAAQRGWVEHFFNSRGYAVTRNALAAAVTHNRVERQWDFGAVRVLAVAWSRDGEFIAVATSDGKVRVVRAAGGREVATFDHGGALVRSLAFSSDGTRVVTGGDYGRVRVFPTARGPALAAFENSAWVESVAFSPDGARVVAATAAGEAVIFPAAGGPPLARLDHASLVKVNAVAFSPDGEHVATGADDGRARIFSAAGGPPLAVFDMGLLVTSIAFSPDGTRVIIGSLDGRARVFPAAGGAALAVLDHGASTSLEAPYAHSSARVESVEFSPDGTRIVTGSDDGRARLFLAAGGAPLTVFQHGAPVRSVAFSPDGGRILTACDDGRVRVFSAAREAPVVTFVHGDGSIRANTRRETRHAGAIRPDLIVMGVAFSRDGNLVATGADDGKARIFPAAGGAPLATFDHDGAWVWSVAFSSDGSRVVTGASDGNARVFSSSGGTPLATFHHENWVTSVAFSPDGERVLTGSHDGKARVFPASGGPALAVFDHGSAPTGSIRTVNSVAFSPDGTRVVTGANDGMVRVFPAAGGPALAVFDHGGSEVSSVAFSPDGTRVLTGSEDGKARVFPAAGGAARATFDHGGAEVRSVAFSPDGEWVVTGTFDGKVRVFPAVGGPALAEFDHGGASVTSIAFSQNGARVLTGAYDGRARVWSIPRIVLAPAPEQIGIACATLRRIGMTRFSAADRQRFPILAGDPPSPCPNWSQ